MQLRLVTLQAVLGGKYPLFFYITFLIFLLRHPFLASFYLLYII